MQHLFGMVNASGSLSAKCQAAQTAHRRANGKNIAAVQGAPKDTAQADTLGLDNKDEDSHRQPAGLPGTCRGLLNQLATRAAADPRALQRVQL